MKFNLFDRFENMFSRITVVAFVGPSGTGKSFHAKILCAQNNIEAIIDDGLLIQDDKILAGHSAKREKTYMGAVRVALFDEKDHRDSVAKVLRKSKIKKIMIIGTSEKMAMKICTRLQLPQPSQIIHIEDIASEEEIAKARNSRTVEGKHVIPVASMEVKRNYPQIFTDSVKEFFIKSSLWFIPKSKRNGKMIEKSIVQPEFSKKGRLEISEAALIQIVMEAVQESNPEIIVKKVTVKKDSRGYKLLVIINVPFDTQLTSKIHRLQNTIIDKIETTIGVLIENVSIVIDKIITTDSFGKNSQNNSQTQAENSKTSITNTKDSKKSKTKNPRKLVKADSKSKDFLSDNTMNIGNIDNNNQENAKKTSINEASNNVSSEKTSGISGIISKVFKKNKKSSTKAVLNENENASNSQNSDENLKSNKTEKNHLKKLTELKRSEILEKIKGKK